MKLETTIAPRLDGTVIVHGLDGQDHVFEPDGSGVLTCEVANDKTVAHLLRQGDNFFPADEADFDRAEALIGNAASVKQGGPTAAGQDAGGEVDADGDDKVDQNALPVEASTPPAPAKAKTARGRKAA